MNDHQATRPLMRVGRGVVLATNATQDTYFLVRKGGAMEKIGLARAASLWAEGERKGWKRLGRREAELIRHASIAKALWGKSKAMRAGGGGDAGDGAAVDVDSAAFVNAEWPDGLKRLTRTIRVEQRKQELQARIDELMARLNEDGGSEEGGSGEGGSEDGGSEDGGSEDGASEDGASGEGRGQDQKEGRS